MGREDLLCFEVRMKRVTISIRVYKKIKERTVLSF